MHLNLPSYDVRLRRTADGATEIYDSLRQKWVALTPEEWVRQHFVNYLVSEHGYPPALMANEVGLHLNNTRRRCDTLIYTRTLTPLVIVEYKRPTVEITAKVFDQIARYNSVIGAEWLMVSNGLKHYCCRFTERGYVFRETLPSWHEITDRATSS